MGLFSTTILGSDKSEIVWLELFLPPVWIESGEYKDQGIGDEQTKIFERRLFGYRFAEISVPWTRFQHYIKLKNKLYCNAAYINIDVSHPDLYYSIPTHFTTPKTLIIKKGNKKFPPNASIINLDKLLQDQSLKFAFFVDRPYGVKLEAIISRYNGQRNFVNIYSPTSDVVAMLQKGRVDYLIEYPDNFEYYLRSHHIPTDQFSRYIIEEEGDQGVLCAVVAVKNEHGKAFIKEMNTIVNKVRGTDAFIETYMRWCPKELLYIRKKGLDDLLAGKYDHKASKFDE